MEKQRGNLIHTCPSPGYKGAVNLNVSSPLFRTDPKPDLYPLAVFTGIVFGCFIPMHTGHEGLIQMSRARHGRTLLVVCGYPGDRGDGFIPYGERISLTKQAFAGCPDVTVLSINDHEIGLTGTFSLEAWETWSRELFRKAGLSPADSDFHWYTGEGDYVDKLKALYPKHCFHLANRLENPISGTEIRKDWKSHQDKIHPIFLDYLERTCSL